MSHKSRKTSLETAPQDVDLEAWIDSDASTSTTGAAGCRTCNHAAASTLRRLLKAMAGRGSHNVTLRKLHSKLQEVHSDYRIGYWGFRDHLRYCEEELYAAARRASIYA